MVFVSALSIISLSVVMKVWRLEGRYRHSCILLSPPTRYYSHIFTINISLPSCCPSYSLAFIIRAQNKRRTLSSLHGLMLQIVWIFPFSISSNLLYRSVGLKVHLFQLANDLFWAVGKYLSQLVLVLKSLRDGAEGSVKSINLSENGDMIYAGWAATPQEQEDLAQPWKDEYTLLKYHKLCTVKTKLYR